MMEHDLLSLSVVLGEARDALRDQREQVRIINTRANVLMGLTGITLGALAKPAHPIALNLVWLVPAAWTLILAVRAYRMRNISAGVSPAELRDELLTTEEHQTQLRICDTLLGAIALNTPMLRERSRMVQHGLVWYAVTLALLIATRIVGGG